MSETAVNSALIDDLARHVRQSVRTCSAHSVGPVAAYNRCATALTTGALSADEFILVGRAIVRKCHDAIAAAEDPGVVRREEQIIRFVTALFGLDHVQP